MIYNKYNKAERRLTDPVQFAYLYKDNVSAEIAAFISSALAYGRVEIIISDLKKVFNILGANILDKITGDAKKLKKSFNDFKHRFNGGDDVTLLLLSLGRIIAEKKNLRNLFIECWDKSGSDIKQTEIYFMNHIKSSIDFFLKKNQGFKPDYLNYLLASPEKNSACKRLNLFLKWALRKDEIDPGIWENDLPHLKKYLVIPLDTHIAACARKSGLTSRKSNDWKTAVEITEALKKFAPDDPLKYDFAICHLGMDNIRMKK